MIKPPISGPRNYLDWCGLTYRHALCMCIDHFGYVQSLSRKFGDLVPFTIFNRPCFLINDPHLIHETLVQKASKIQKQRRNTGFIERVLSRGMLTIQGEEWRRDRLAIQPLLRTDKLDGYAAIASRVTEEEMGDWKSGESVNLQPVLGRIYLRTFGQCLFGRDSGSETSEWFDAAIALSDRQMQEVLQPFIFPDWFPFPAQNRKRRAKRALQDAAKFMMLPAADGELSPIHNVLKGVFDGGQDELMDAVLSETMTFIVAGVHTTASAAEWALLEIARNAEIQRAVIDESRSATLSSETGSLDIDLLPYISQVFQETVRLHPPVWALIGREAVEDFDLDGTKIPKGSWIFIYPKLVHRDPRWFPNPTHFDPERFAPGAIDSIPPRAYIPFGVGPHRCIGTAVAELVVPIVVATILRNYRLEPVGDLHAVKDRDSTVMYPRGGVVIRPKPHEKVEANSLCTADV